VQSGIIISFQHIVIIPDTRLPIGNQITPCHFMSTVAGVWPDANFRPVFLCNRR
jgi:hypothetical protein